MMKFSTFLLLFLACSSPHRTRATIVPLVPRLGCLARFATIQFLTNQNEDFKQYFLHDDSSMSLWQTGRYVGAEAILEYVNFVSPLNPLWSAGRELHSYEIDEASGNFATNYTVANMFKLYLDVKKRYIPKIDVYYTDAYIDLVFQRFFDTEELRAYICNIYEGNTCSAFLDPPDNCMAALSALEQTSVNGRVDGNSAGCRMLHSVLAEERNVHCPHISFEPLEDFQGKIKCQTEGNLTAYDLYTQADLDAFANYMIGRGLDPELGHDWVEGTV